MKNIAVIFGGKSSEHDISIITACALMQNLDEKKYNIIPIYIQKNGEFLYGSNLKNIETFQKNNICGRKVMLKCGCNKLYIKKLMGFKPHKKIDFCFVACHGINGEDGSISGLLNLCNIPYSCADILPSSIAMDKIATKIMCKGLKVPVLSFYAFCKQDFLQDENKLITTIQNKIGYPCIIKPAKLGSSIGITRCENSEDLQDALNLAFCLDENILVEKALTNFKEYNIAVLKLGNEILLSKIEQPIVNNNILSFEDKYLNNSKTKGMESLDRIIPAKLDKNLENQIKNIAYKVYKNLNFSGVIRIDFLYNNDKIYLNEINSIPGSFANYLWDFSYKLLLESIIYENTNDFKNKQSLMYSFESSVLKAGGGKK